MNKNLFIFTEAGEDIGFGHIMRCQALSAQFENNGTDVTIYLYTKGDINLQESKIKVANWLQASFFEKDGAFFNDSTALVDSYLAEASVYKKIKSVFSKVIVIDDYNRIVYPNSDILINPGIWGNKLDYSNQTARIEVGSQFIILRNDFIKYRNQYTVRKDIKSIGITLGGNDFRKLIPVLTKQIANDNAFENILVFSGSEAYKNELTKTISHNNIEFFGYLDADTMAQKLLSCDVVVSAAGQTINELAFLGIPTIAIGVDHDQKFNLQGFHKNGFINNELQWDQPDLLKMTQAILESMQDAETRLKTHAIGQKIVDGNGTENIVRLFS